MSRLKYSPSVETDTPGKANDLTPPRNAWSKPNNNVKDNAAWGANNNAWSPSEMGGSTKPDGKSNPSPGVKDDGGDGGELWNAPAAKGWSQSEVDGGSQAGPRSTPGKAGNKPRGGKTPNPGGRGTPPKSALKPVWGDAKDWTPSELGQDDSVSQHGDGFRTAPSMEPGKKSWADQVEDEFDYENGDEPAPMVAPAPDLEGDKGESDDDSWVASGKKKGKGKGKAPGKARSATGWSDVTSPGMW